MRLAIERILKATRIGWPLSLIPNHYELTQLISISPLATGK